MRYIISDIHGCYEEYQELLKKIDFSEKDQLYILGDTVDRGPEPIKVLQDIMSRRNVIYILGNHDFLFVYFVRKLGIDFTGTGSFSKEDKEDFHAYLKDGGRVTIEQFLVLSEAERKEICSYLRNAKAYEVLEHCNKKYILVHAGISDFEESKALEEHRFIDFIYKRMDYDKRYYSDEDTFIVTGHTPTIYINNPPEYAVYKGNGHIAIDCGCVFGGKLAAYCIESGQVTYVDALG